MSISSRLVPALVATLAVLALASVAKADGLDSIMAAKVIKVAVPQDFAPFGFVGKDLKPQGYDIDMANLIAKEMGVKVELVPVTSANRIPYLQTKKVDLVISSLGKNAEREKAIDFSAPYAPFYSAVYSPKGKYPDVKALADLTGKTLGAARGTIEEQELTATVPKDTTIKRFEDNNATIAAYMSGQIDLVATGNTIAAVIAERNPAQAPEMKFMVKNSPCYVGLNKEEPRLLAKVNEIIGKAKTSGELTKLSEKWLKAPLPAGF